MLYEMSFVCLLSKGVVMNKYMVLLMFFSLPATASEKENQPRPFNIISFLVDTFSKKEDVFALNTSRELDTERIQVTNKDNIPHLITHDDKKCIPCSQIGLMLFWSLESDISYYHRNLSYMKQNKKPTELTVKTMQRLQQRIQDNVSCADLAARKLGLSPLRDEWLKTFLKKIDEKK